MTLQELKEKQAYLKGRLSGLNDCYEWIEESPKAYHEVEGMQSETAYKLEDVEAQISTLTSDRTIPPEQAIKQAEIDVLQEVWDYVKGQRDLTQYDTLVYLREKQQELRDELHKLRMAESI